MHLILYCWHQLYLSVQRDLVLFPFSQGITDGINRTSGGSNRNSSGLVLSATNPRLSFRRPSDRSKEASTSAPTATRIPTEVEFMREAELFFSNLESEFMWPFLQRHFFLSSQKVRRGWISAVQFLVEHLPTDTYPEVRGCHLPRMVSGLTAALSERMVHLTLAEIAEFIDLLAVIIAQIQEVRPYLCWERWLWAASSYIIWAHYCRISSWCEEWSSQIWTSDFPAPW